MDADTVRIVRAKGTLRVLAILLAVSLLPALAVRATHSPTTEDVVAYAQGTLAMECLHNGGEQDCSGVNPTTQGPRDAVITPATGPLQQVSTQVNAWFTDFGDEMQPDDQAWNAALHNVGCNNANGLASFMADLGSAASADKTVGPKTVGECSVKGTLFVTSLRVPYYVVTSTLLPSAFTPKPTPTPKPTVKPTPRPTARPTASPTATPSPTPIPTPTPSPTPTASPTATPTAAPSFTASPTPEEIVAGATGSPGESPGGGGWQAEVPSPDRVSTKPIDVAGSLGLAVLLMLLMAFPGELFNDTFQANYDEIAGWFGWKKKS